MTKNHEGIPCPYCTSTHFAPWAQELGFNAVRCTACELIYCNPRPALADISAAVQTGSHTLGEQSLNVKARRIDAKVRQYRRVFAGMFADMWRAGRPVAWLDVGAGYGEIMQAVQQLAPAGSRIEGLEPMAHKARAARAQGLSITQDYLRADHPPVDVVSLVDVFSHIPDFGAVLATARQVLRPDGQLFIETGNLADLERRGEFPGELGLPDHLVFAGEKHLLGYLDRAGFDVVAIRRWRIDGLANLSKNAIKALMGRPCAFGIPYRSRYRQIQIRARIRNFDHA